MPFIPVFVLFWHSGGMERKARNRNNFRKKATKAHRIALFMAYLWALVLVLQRGLEPRRARRFATGFAVLSASLKNAPRLVSVGSISCRHETSSRPVWGGCLSGAPGQFKSEPEHITETEVPRETSVSERKKDSADVQFSRLLRKPRKRNGAEFF